MQHVQCVYIYYIYILYMLKLCPDSIIRCSILDNNKEEKEDDKNRQTIWQILVLPDYFTRSRGRLTSLLIFSQKKEKFTANAVCHPKLEQNLTFEGCITSGISCHLLNWTELKTVTWHSRALSVSKPDPPWCWVTNSSCNNLYQVSNL